MELPQVKALAKLKLSLLAHCQKCQLSRFIGRRLSWPHHVAFYFPGDLFGGHAGFCNHVFDGLLAAPSLGMHTCIHHQAHGTKHFCLQSTKITQWVIVV